MRPNSAERLRRAVAIYSTTLPVLPLRHSSADVTTPMAASATKDLLQVPSALHGLHHRYFVRILQVRAHRNSDSYARNFHTKRF